MYEIYLVINTINQKKYVGQTCQGVMIRWNQHQSASKTIDNYFYRALRKHGFDAFQVSVIATCETLEEANQLEKEWIARYHCIDSEEGYNGTHGGDGSSPTLLTCAKISQTRKQKFEDPEFRARMAAANLGKNHTPDGCQNISKSLQGNQYRKGIPHSDEIKEKIKQSLKKAYAEGRHLKTGGSVKGYIAGPMSDEQKAKIAEGVKKVRAEKFWSTRKKVDVQQAA